MAVPGRRFQYDDERCDLCDKNRLAVGYCLQCCECLCVDCEMVHRRSRASKLHEILPEKDIPPEIFDDHNVCREHGNETFIYFCVKHQKPCCYKCLVSPKHKGCNLQPIDDIAKDFEKSNEYKNVKSSITGLFMKLENVRKDSIKYHAETEDSIIRSKHAVRNFRRELQNQVFNVSIIKENELDMQKQLNDIERDSTSHYCSSSHQELTKLENLLEFLEKQKWSRRLMLTTKIATQKIAQVERDLKETGMLDLQYKSKFWSFEPNRESCKMMQRKETFGKIKVQERVRGEVRNVLPSEEKIIDHPELILFALVILVGIIFGVLSYHIFVVSVSCNKNSECYNCLRLVRGYNDDDVRQLYRQYGDDTVPTCKDILRRTNREVVKVHTDFFYELLRGESLFFFLPEPDKKKAFSDNSGID